MTSETLKHYNTLGWSVFSCDLGFDGKKKTIRFHTASWKDSPCLPDSTGYGLRTGQVSNITAIDIDDPTLEHNKKLIELCEQAGAIKQNTKKGIHFLFQYTPDLKQTTNNKLALDIRNDGGFLFIDPSHYKAGGSTVKYSIVNMPETKDDIPTCPPEVISFIQTLYRPNLDAKEEKTKKKLMKDHARQSKSDIIKSKLNLSKKEQDVRRLLELIDPKHADDYSDWISVAMALVNADLSPDLFDEFSRRSQKYKEGEPYYVYGSLKQKPFEDIPITLASIYWWLKQENKEEFIHLVMLEGEENYEMMKAEFEKTTFIVGSKLIHLHSNGTTSYLSDSDAMLKFANKQIRTYDKEKDKMIVEPFYKKWKHDPERKEYDRMDFLPQRENCPPDVYNAFKGLKAEKYDFQLTAEQIEDLVEPVLVHLRLLTSDQPEYFLKWLANIVQRPWNKSQVAILLRDVTRFLKSGGGTGKNAFIEWFGNTILGSEYFVVFGDNKVLYDGFNELLENKLLVLVEEASGRDNGKEDNQLKSNITGKTKQINRKFCPKYTQQDYTNYIFFSNEVNPIPMAGQLGQRRICSFDVDVSRKDDVDYFTQLMEHLEREEVSYAFYKYLMDYDTYKTPILFQTKRPITPCMCDLKRLNANLLLRWVIDRVEKDSPIRGESETLFKAFMDWCSGRNERKSEDNHWSHTKFVRELTNNPDLVVPQKNPGDIRLNMARLREDLVKNQYIFKQTGDVRYAMIEDDEE